MSVNITILWRASFANLCVRRLLPQGSCDFITHWLLNHAIFKDTRHTHVFPQRRYHFTSFLFTFGRLCNGIWQNVAIHLCRLHCCHRHLLVGVMREINTHLRDECGCEHTTSVRSIYYWIIKSPSRVNAASTKQLLAIMIIDFCALIWQENRLCGTYSRPSRPEPRRPPLTQVGKSSKLFCLRLNMTRHWTIVIIGNLTRGYCLLFISRFLHGALVSTLSVHTLGPGFCERPWTFHAVFDNRCRWFTWIYILKP